MFDEEGQLLRSQKLYGADGKIVTDAITGNQLILTSPQGVFVHEKNKEIYIADTGLIV